MGPGGFMPPPPPGDENRKNREPKPKSLREVPGYIWRTGTKFCYRLLYIFRLVWETRPWILFVMMFMALFNGIMPIVGATISAKLLNTLSDAYSSMR